MIYHIHPKGVAFERTPSSVTVHVETFLTESCAAT
jgi:hypothetical protein